MAIDPRLVRLATACALGLAVSACKREPPPAPRPSPSAPAIAAPLHSPSAPPTPATVLDAGALHDRSGPELLLRYYKAALEQGRWVDAAKAWRSHAGVTAATLRASYGRAPALTITFGEGDVEGGAGSIYDDVPVTLRFGSGPPQHGTLTLRRVNDVPGATPEQLDWRIERATIGAGP